MVYKGADSTILSHLDIIAAVKPNVERALINTYGFVPEPTPGEQAQHELLIDSNTFQEQQLKSDILRLAISANLTNDIEMARIVLDRWNELYPNNQYHNFELLLGVELSP